MSKYLLEIKNRLFLICITWLSTIIISYLYKETLLFLVIQPNTIMNPNKNLIFFYFIFTNVTEIFNVYIKLTAFLGFQVFTLYLLYHFFVFVSPALFRAEYLNFSFGVKTVGVIWGVSVILFFLVLVDALLSSDKT